MKKKVIFILFIILIQLSLTSATSYECSDNRTPRADSEEIREGEMESILGLKIGLCNYYESNIYSYIETTLLLDANTITLANDTEILGIELNQGNSTIKYTNATSKSVIITLGGSTEEIELGDCSPLGGFNVMVKKIEGSGGAATVDLLVGHTKKTLKSVQNNSYIFTMDSKQYGIDLLGGSSNSILLRVSSCKNATLTQIVEIVNIENNTTLNQTNVTSNDTIIIENQTTQIQPECLETGYRNGTEYCNSQGQYAYQLSTKDSCAENYECSTNYCKENICSKKSFFSRVIDWIKGIFS